MVVAAEKGWLGFQEGRGLTAATTVVRVLKVVTMPAWAAAAAAATTGVRLRGQHGHDLSKPLSSKQPEPEPQNARMRVSIGAKQHRAAPRRSYSA